MKKHRLRNERQPDRLVENIMTIPEISAAVARARTIGDVSKGLVSLDIDRRVKEAAILCSRSQI
jgi:hypothetical protein